ncbi:MAG: hypothetical protein LBO77_06635 [Desulfovibrio sp.]|jgi:hypothetical protein|nr:hypothetical protein [Desulfovibrio sp.]
MDAHTFRVVGGQLPDLLKGSRLEKIHSPAPGITMFRLFPSPAGRLLVLLSGPPSPCLFFSSHHLANPSCPPALTMRLRKYAAGRRLGRGILDFSRRCLALPLLERGYVARYLLLDLRRGPEILPILPEEFGREPAWYEGNLEEGRLYPDEQAGDPEGPWHMYSVLTPLLRETLAALDPLEGKALLVDLKAGGGDLFAYGDASRRPALISAWELPETVARRRGLRLICELPPARCPAPVQEIATRLGESLLAARTDASTAGTAREERRGIKRLRRLGEKLEQEEKRLEDMLALREDARLLQANLWRFAREERKA